MKPGLIKRIRSYFYPVRMRSATSAVNPVLELYYYQGRWQLATADALYSDGVKYRPLLAAFKSLSKILPSVQNVLVLGTGLGSAVHILHQQGYHPNFTLVELDSVVLRWALEFLPPNTATSIKPVCADASDYLERDTTRYDLIIVDVFTGRHVPSFVMSNEFLLGCKEHLLPGGHLVLNYMINKPADEGKAKAALKAAFGKIEELSFHINRVYVATV